MYNNIKRAVIEIEGGCNYSTCVICPQIYGRGSFNASMSFKDYCRLVDECAELGLEIIQLDGSGEATMNKNLPEYINYATQKNIKVQIYSNGFNMKNSFMNDCVDAGLHLFRFSVIGYNRETYKQMTSQDNFDQILKNALEMKKYIDNTKSNLILASYHLILNDVSEIKYYRKNFIDIVESQAQIWKQHNWGGNMNINRRSGIKKTCGRPFAQEITIRAGGINGHKLAVTPCCQTLGRDEEAVLSHCDNMTVTEAFNSLRYTWLREMHSQQRFSEIPFCKDCDFLYDDESVLVWSNDNSKLNKMIGIDFELERL